jgi:hypothetical protein
MPPFDPRAYEEQVLKPMRRLLPHLPDDLQTRYAVDPDMDETALRERVDGVVRLWNRLAMRPGRAGLVAKQLTHSHHELEAAGSDLGSAAFWRDWRARRTQAVGTAVDKLATELATGWGPFGMITPAQLALDGTGYPELDPAAVDRARTQAGLALVEPATLPTAPGTATPLTVLNDAMVAAGAVTVPELLFPGLISFGLLDGLTVTPAPARRTVALTAEAIAERMRELDEKPDSQRVRDERNAVGILLSEARAGVDLAALALFHLLQPIRQRQAGQGRAGTLFQLLTRAKVERRDAARITFGLLAQGGRGHEADEVVTLLAEGRLLAADKLATALPSDEAGDAAREAVARRHARVTALRAEAADELRAGRDPQAAAKLGDALRQAVDLPGLAEELAAVPSTPVLAATAVAERTGVRISWRPAPEHAGSTVVRVVRGPGRSPQDPDDGLQIPADGAHATDPEPPVGASAHYAVFARTEPQRWSGPVGATVEVIPPVADVAVDGGRDVISGRWRVHPGVSGVEVTRSTDPDTAGEPVPVDALRRGFRDGAVTDGVRYYYRITAVYPSPDGGPAVHSAAVVVRGATRPDAHPVRRLGTSVLAVSGCAPAVRLAWQQRPGNEVVLRRAGRPCPWTYGTAVTAGELATWGSELDGELSVHGPARTLTAALPPGRSWIVPFTLTPEGALCGQDAYVEVVEPVRRLQARRFGDDILLTWLWPPDVSAAAVEWSGGERLLSRQQYRDEGGCRLASVATVNRVVVTAVIRSSTGEGRSTPASVQLEDRPPRLSYQIGRRGHRLLGGVRATVTVHSAEPVPRATLLLVGSPGAVMPLSARDAVELLREQVALQPGVPVVLPEVRVPPTLRPPYWLRCFLLDPPDAGLADPPVDQLKVT